MKVSAVVLTYNEEVNIADCIDSLKTITNDIVVLDSFSTDNTIKVAEAVGARTVVNKFEGYAKQRNFALEKITYKYEWLLMLDADERLTNELANEIKDIPENSNIVSLYRFKRKDYFLGKWIRRSSGYPTWFGRLLKLGEVTVEREINEEYNTAGEVGYLKEHIIHYPFNKGFSSWLEKHNRYSTMEAVLLFEGNKKICFKSLFSKDPAIRRSQIKTIVYSLPMRPFIIFIILYFFRLGFLDGRAGYTFCKLRSLYEYMIDCKVNELVRRGENKPV